MRWFASVLLGKKKKKYRPCSRMIKRYYIFFAIRFADGQVRWFIFAAQFADGCVRFLPNSRSVMVMNLPVMCKVLIF